MPASPRLACPERDTAPQRCRRKFLRYFRRGFQDPKYLEWEREYKWAVHEHWQQVLGRPQLDRAIHEERFLDTATLAVRVEQRSRSTGFRAG